MRAVRKLERRFKLALANIEKETDIQTGVDENANLSKQITILEANGVEKDEKINTLNADLATLTKNAATSDKQVADTKAAQDEITKLHTALAQAQTAKTDALQKITALQGKLQKVEAEGSASADVDALKTRLAESEAKADAHFRRARELRGALQQIRTALKDNVLDADTINTAMQIELEALQAQRDTDLMEVNVILEKLTPLVEGK
ncbi:MAG: hypothetical protein V7761_02960 [Amylibacter sp.]